MVVIAVSIDKNLLIRVDEHVKRIGAGSSRSGLIHDALECYLDIHRGINNRIRRKQIYNELAK